MEKRFILRTIWRRWGWVLLCLLLSCSLTAFEKDGEEASPTMTVRREGEGLWSLSVIPDLYELTEGNPMAILMELEVPRGWRIKEISAGEGAVGLTLTHGNLSSDRVKVLLDGTAAEGASGPLLWVELERNDENTANTGGYMGVTGDEQGKITLFVLRENGKIEKNPLSVEMERGWEGEETADTEVDGEGTSEPSDTATDETHEALETHTYPCDTGGELVKNPDHTESPEVNGNLTARLPVFLGCRETEVTEGSFSVQFLFCGGNGWTPVVCMAGGGVLRAESGVMPALSRSRGCGEGCEDWSYCSFSGLSADRIYVFFVGTDEGWVRVLYRNGEFQGFW